MCCTGVTNLLATTVGDSQEKSIKASTVTELPPANVTATSHVTVLGQGTEPTNVHAVYVMPYMKAGKKGMLIVNKKSVGVQVSIKSAVGGQATVVEVNTDPRCSEPGFEPQVRKIISAAGTLDLGPFAVAVVTKLLE